MTSITDTVMSGVNNIMNVFSSSSETSNPEKEEEKEKMKTSGLEKSPPEEIEAFFRSDSGEKSPNSGASLLAEEFITGSYKITLLGKDGEPVETITQEETFTIHLDDSIRVVKNKIIKMLDKHPLSYKEIYLFSQNKIRLVREQGYQQLTSKMTEGHRRSLDVTSIYKNITKNGEQPLDYAKMKQVCNSLDFHEKVVLDESKKTYTLEEFTAVLSGAGMDDKEHTVDVPIGQRFEKSYQWLFSANPYHISMVLPDIKKNPLFSFDNSILLNYNIHHEIFVCSAENVLEFTEKLNITNEYVLQMYFPFLFKDGIRKLDDLKEKKQMLLDEYNKTIDENTWKLYKTVDMFYQIDDQATTPLLYSSNGINSFRMVLHADFANILPLDTIFKRIHAVPNIPFIKYNPGFKRENIYRLYSDKIATNGKKIPTLSATEISKLSKETGRTGQITLMIQETYENQSLQIFLNFNKDGKIMMKCGLNKPIATQSIFPLIQQTIQPILEKLNAFLFETGYQIRIPEHYEIGGYMENRIIEIEQIQYVSSIQISKKMDIKKYKGCLSSVFDIVETDVSSEKGGKLTFKRVENYQDMDPISLAISQTYSKTREIEDVITVLKEDFKLTEDQARERTVKFFGEHTMLQGKLVDNTGFPITMTVNPSNNMLTMTVDQIASLEYVDVLKIYLDSMVRIFQEPTSIPAIGTFITQCKKSINYKNVDKSHIDNIVATDTAYIAKVAQPILFVGDDSDFFAEAVTNREEEEDEGLEDEEVNESDFDFEDDAPKTSQEVKQKKTSKSDSEDSDNESMFGMDVEGGKGGGDDGDDEDENLEIIVEGKSLKNPNPFQEKIEKYDPVIVLKKEKGQYNPYSKSCPPAVMRQPVLLTNSEKERIDSAHPESYSSALKYGSDPDPEKQFWYICPRYWSLKENTSLTQEEVDEILKTNPQAIIPSKAKVVPKGAFIYEFNAPKEHVDEKGNYITHYPGLMTGKHPDGFSLPCCFKRQQAIEKDLNSTKITQKINVYVMSANSRPLSDNRFGFLPEPLQRFLKTDNNKCVEKTNSALIKANTSCILRYGVEASESQSFIGCVADLYAELHSVKKPTISEMRKIISESITLDMFLQYHNGSLVAIFRPANVPADTDPKNPKYADSWFAKEIASGGSEEELAFLKETVASYEAFIKYLLDETTYIDHTYLWDIVTQPNPKLIPNGMNMVILMLPKPNQVEILCPTSAYSPKLFDASRGTWILFKDGDFYEPIYVFENKKKVVIHRLFHSGVKSLDSKMENLIQMVEKAVTSQCRPQSSLPNVYEFKRNISATEMYVVLSRYNYIIHLQVMNYQSKIVGFVTSYAKTKGESTRFFVPCAPSTLLDNLDLILMDQVKDWKDYKTTIQEFNQLYVKTEGKIKCSPKTKIVDDDKIIGILTETEQYVKISPAMENTPDELQEMESMDYLEADKVIVGSVAPNNKRVRTIRNIHMESRFYRIFRTTVRELLSQYENRFYKLQIMDMLENLTYSYSQKMGKIEAFLRKVVGDSVAFQRMKEDDIDYLDNDTNFTNYTQCIKCERNVCKKGDDGVCHLHFPRENLVMGMRNDELYYARLSDELLRFHRVRLFMLEPMHYLNLTNIDYQINDDEILLLETFLKSENFSDLRLFNFNEYLRQIPYDIAGYQGLP